MTTYFVLQIPNIVIIPSLEELQDYFGKVVTSIIETHKNVIVWGQRYQQVNQFGTRNDIMHEEYSI
jgi:dynein heavy chain